MREPYRAFPRANQTRSAIIYYLIRYNIQHNSQARSEIARLPQSSSILQALLSRSWFAQRGSAWQRDRWVRFQNCDVTRWNRGDCEFFRDFCTAIARVVSFIHRSSRLIRWKPSQLLCPGERATRVSAPKSFVHPWTSVHILERPSGSHQRQTSEDVIVCEARPAGRDRKGPPAEPARYGYRLLQSPVFVAGALSHSPLGGAIPC